MKSHAALLIVTSLLSISLSTVTPTSQASYADSEGATFDPPTRMTANDTGIGMPSDAEYDAISLAASQDGNHVYSAYAGGRVRVSHDGGQTFNNSTHIEGLSIPRIAAAGDNIYASDGYGFAVSHDNGNTFSPSIPIASSGWFFLDNQMAASGSHVYIVWLHASDIGWDKILFRESNDTGSSFGTTITMDDLIGTANETIQFPKVGAWGNHVYVGWANNLTPYGVWHAYVRVSDDYGVTFGPRIDLGPGFKVHRVLATQSGAYIFWNGLFIAASHDNGASFSHTGLNSPLGLFATEENDNVDMIVVSNPSSSADDVYVTWSTLHNIGFGASHDGGITFGDTIYLADGLSSGDHFALQPRLAASGSNVYATWAGGDVYFRMSTDKGGSFESPILIKKMACIDGGVCYDYANDPKIATAANSDTLAPVYLLWQQNGFRSYHYQGDVMFARGVSSFMVIPESPIGSIALVASIFASLGAFLGIKRYKGGSLLE